MSLSRALVHARLLNSAWTGLPQFCASELASYKGERNGQFIMLTTDSRADGEPGPLSPDIALFINPFSKGEPMAMSSSREILITRRQFDDPIRFLRTATLGSPHPQYLPPAP